MFKFLTDKLENPNRPLLGPNVKALEFWGLLLPDNVAKKYMYIFLHISVILFTLTECVDIWFIKSDLKMLSENLKITMLAIISVIKVTTFLTYQNDWRSIIEYVTEADIKQRKTNDETNKKIIKNFTKYSRKITFFYWSLMFTTVAVVMLHPVIKYLFSQSYRHNVSTGEEPYVQVVSAWTPFDKSTVLGYITACALQSYGSIYGGGWITSFDTNAIVIMVFFRGELELLRRDSATMFGSLKEPVANAEVKRRMQECHRRHADLVKYARVFDSCLSPIMMLYMIVCSIMLCVTAYQVTSERNLMQILMQVEYLVFGVSQLFLYCWHSNDVLNTSYNLVQGPYESTWWNRNLHRKDLVLLLTQYRKEIVFSAGPFAQLTIPTFINILKGTYSYYTLMKQSQISKT